MDFDLVVDLLIAYAVGRRARSKLQVGALSGRALDTASTLVGELVMTDLGSNAAIDQLMRETRSGAEPSEATRIAAREVLQATARMHRPFRNALVRAISGHPGSYYDAAPPTNTQPPQGGGYQGSAPRPAPPPYGSDRKRRRRRLRDLVRPHGQQARDHSAAPGVPGRPRLGEAVQLGPAESDDTRETAERLRRMTQSTDDEAAPADREPDEEIWAYACYPRLEAPDVVVAHEPFQVTVGLAETFDMATMVSGQMHVYSSDPEFEIEIELLVDPKSLVVAGDPHTTVRVTLADPYPRHTFTMRALTDPSLTGERTLRLILRKQGRIIGLASRVLVVAPNASRLATTPPPPPPARQLLDLGSLLDEAPPDLVVVVVRADEPDTYLWDAYALGGHLAIPDAQRRSSIDHSARDFATYTRRLVKAEAFRGVAIFDNLKGYGDLVASALPSGIRSALRELVRDRTGAPAVLWLTEESFVPWELAVLDPPLHTAYAGLAPFLGAHLAMSRWPFSPEGPAPSPCREHPVFAQAVLTADYDGVRNFPPLPAAVAEAVRFREKYGPVTALPPMREQVIDCLEGRVPVDLLHVALHGTFDDAVQEDGLVLLEPRGDGFTASFLTALAVRGLRNTSTTPFIYLNACSVGAGQSILGSYAGFATALLRTGAIGVVAPLWTIDDTVAAELAARFYDGAFADPPVPVAELLRRARAEYTRDRVAADPDRITPTHLGYLAFGHPRLTLRRNRSPER
ncbi:CHAT domain-containing protein [Nocardia cyriacigeorgica]|uniref:CHAT domain-containing protein n=1 Tax=Nocardia cyriacigeorgica TaxID=135487 RepID=UPI0018953E67|nr:CHAT domain-containing protein [Nocardia cyriacigeorgica]MBF6454217.1 CHAT domain-containing protein [Nocardia cyriacigeorgica]MBF6479936.1 CHAT domain-containing protein [Nocardia cyriacigeorgica]MBF6552111.1 CHAT domain-containing protein [Nocardia cyriacigeorgica]